MEPLWNDVGSRGSREDNQLSYIDLERARESDAMRGSRSMNRLWNTLASLRKFRLVSHPVKNIASLVTLICVAEFIYILYLKGGLIRIPNDPYDIIFGQGLDWNSPSIWDDDRQSFIHNVVPIPVHSHNDYWRSLPLFEALGSGCISIEADVHLQNFDLLVGHNEQSLNDQSTLRSMYLAPLQRMLEAQNENFADGTWRGIFNRAPHQTLVLLVDLKTTGPEIFSELHTQLQPLRELNYLTYWNGSERILRPLTIVTSGNTSFEYVTALDASHRDVFWDAKLDLLSHSEDNWDVEPVVFKYNRSNSYLASADFKHHAMLDPYGPQFSHLLDTPQRKDLAAPQIEQAKTRGLISRYWNTPPQPPNVREDSWRVLIEHQVGILNMDDMGIVRARAAGWGKISL